MKIVFPYDGYESLGIGYLASAAIRGGYEVNLFPLAFGDYIRGHARQLPHKIEKAKNSILQLRPDVVALSLNSFTAGSFIELAALLREAGIVTIAGGPHCTAEPALTAGTNAFNAVIAGEADSVFINAIESTLDGNYSQPWLFTSENRNAEYSTVENLDEIPFPAKSLFYKINSYEAEDYKIITSRGCPYRCIFCSHSNPCIKNRYRKRSIENVIEELITAKRNFNIKTVYFLDDVFAIDENRIKDFVSVYKQKIGLPFHAICHPNNINEGIAFHLKDGGCYAVRLGVETLNESIKGMIGRPETNQKIADAIKCFKKRDIHVEVDHILNLPGETLDDARDGVRFYNDIRPGTIKVYWLMPLPGTIWFEQASLNKLVSKEQAEKIRTGYGFGKHSYLFYNKAFHSREFLGIHFLLSYLPLLPGFLVRFLLKTRADRLLRIPSFLILVGIPGFLHTFSSWNNVGKDHIKRLLLSIQKKILPTF